MSPKPKNTPHRVLLSLPTDLYDTISRVSAAMEKPRAEIIRDLLSEQQPILEHMATMLEQAKAGKLDQAMKGWQKMTGEALKGLGLMMAPPELKKPKQKSKQAD
ncbi:MAG: hypothetical protein KF876_17170 [Nitrospira sp.]|nr:hypothetical protein [Nitrospira sp.]